MERVAETLLVRRLAALAAGAETSSRASIMVNSGLNFKTLSRQFQARQNRPVFKNRQFSRKTGFSSKLKLPY
jgi:hypothetical protein